MFPDPEPPDVNWQESARLWFPAYAFGDEFETDFISPLTVVHPISDPFSNVYSAVSGTVGVAVGEEGPVDDFLQLKENAMTKNITMTITGSFFIITSIIIVESLTIYILIYESGFVKC
jgi:hypothetical protein